MYHLGEPTTRRSEPRRYRNVLFACQGLVAVLLAVLFVPTPGIIATAAIAGTALALMGVQHAVARRLGTKSAELIGKQEALLAEAGALYVFNNSRDRLHLSFADEAQLGATGSGARRLANIVAN